MVEEKNRPCADAKNCPINPVQFGKLIGTMDQLESSVRILSTKVDNLMETKNRGIGILSGVTLAGGAVGALLHKIGETLFK